MTASGDAPSSAAPAGVPRGPGTSARARLALELALVLGVALLVTATAVPSVFTMDENNYLATVLALRDGQLAVKNTAGLTPTSELLFFDPEMFHVTVSATPVYSRAPPLYAFFALPFVPFGWYGLVFVNALAGALLVWLLARRLAATVEDRGARVVAVVALAGGAYLLEYAQGVWPHLLSAALTFGGFLLAARVIATGRFGVGVLAGLVSFLAVGVRYQNIVAAAGIGLGVLLFAERRRLTSALAFAVGAAPPLAASAVINWYRLGSPNPISKGDGYLQLAAGTPPGLVDSAWVTLRMLTALVIDFSQRPPLGGRGHGYMVRDPVSGAVAIGEHLKKALVQSSPWIALSLVILCVVWLRPAVDRSRDIRRASLIVLPGLALMALAGPDRTDGLCFNQRYYLDLLPFLALALGHALVGIPRKWGAAGAGAVASVGLLVALGRIPAQAPFTFMKVPLFIGALLVIGYAARRFSVGPVVLWVALGAAVGWGGAVHAIDDLSYSRALRAQTRRFFDEVEPSIPDRSALIVTTRRRDGMGPLQLDRDVVIVVPEADGGRAVVRLTNELLGQGRRVFVYLPLMDRGMLALVLRGRPSRVVAWMKRTGEPILVEVVAP